MRIIRLTCLTLVFLGASCPEAPWSFQPIPPGGPRSEVFLDTGAVVKARVDGGEVVVGSVLVPFAPKGEQVVLCEGRNSRCGGLDEPGARGIPLSTIERLEFAESGTGRGAALGGYAGMFGALVNDDENVLLILAGALAGGATGALIGSRFTDWITVGERSESGEFTWAPDVPVLIPLPPADYHFTTGCSGDDLVRADTLIAVVRRTDTAYRTDVLRAWAHDTSAHRIIPIHTEGVRCPNAAWKAPVLLAAPELEASALSFTPSPGKVRIYVFQAHKSHADEHLRFTIAIDSMTVGRTAPGTYLMVEVEPGSHRVSHLGKSEGDVVLNAVADSAYFLEARHKRGIWRRSFDRLEIMDPMEARAVILTAQMVRTSPSAPIPDRP